MFLFGHLFRQAARHVFSYDFFLFIGSLAGFRNIFRMAKRIYTRDEGRDENGRKESKR